jgi:Fe-S-cluster containining protein
MDDFNPCLSCGVCCAHFRVSFYWAETDPFLGGVVPVELTEDINDRFKCMRGTNCKQPRCVALQGEVGTQVSCAIYENRPTTCRDFPLWMEDGQINPECQRIRVLHGLPPVDPPTHPSFTPPIEPKVA